MHPRTYKNRNYQINQCLFLLNGTGGIEVDGPARGIRMSYYDMTIMRLTIQSLYFFLCYKLIHVIVLRRYRFQVYCVRCNFWVCTVSTVCIILFASRDSTVERHEEGVGVPAEGWMRSTMCVLFERDDKALVALTASRVYKC